MNTVKITKKTTDSLWKYYRDEPSNPFPSSSESFEYKTNITGNTYHIRDCEGGYDGKKVSKYETEIVIPVKYLSNF